MSAVLVAFLVSIGAGGFGSMVGIGGGLVIVPLLSVVLGYDVKVAIAASLIGVIATSLSAGNVSGRLGGGGGLIKVPTMTVLMRVPIRVATTTSTYMLAATATASVVVYLASGQLDPTLAAPVALGVIVGARLGARFSMRLSQDALRLAFAAIATVFAVSMFVEVLAR